ncbi:MAG TPA: alpha/beta fold hydrolase [Gemmatimonadales bacterium]|nr:alpha/beta fold hydrolase [Gemmatimonadales bacterium]
MPAPHGPWPLGTRILHLADSTRGDAAGPRELTVQLWYPTTREAQGAPAPYVAEPAVLAAMRADGYYHQADGVFDRWAAWRVAATLDAPVAPARKPRRLVVLSHGQGFARANYTALATELASRGWIVATVDHPYGGLMVTARGRVIRAGDDGAVGTSDSTLGRMVHDWALDATFVLDRVAAAGRDGLDPRRAAMVGHSLGGAAALEACALDRRFAGCVDLDGAPFGRVVEAGTRGPVLLLNSNPDYTDAELARKGRTREQWDAMGTSILRALTDVAAKSSGPVYRGTIRGTSHVGFSDAPFAMPEANTHFGGRLLAPERTHEIVSGTVLAFLDACVAGNGRWQPGELGRRFPELTLTRLDPQR